jgi:hypothetical protein
MSPKVVSGLFSHRSFQLKAAKARKARKSSQLYPESNDYEHL